MASILRLRISPDVRSLGEWAPSLRGGLAPPLGAIVIVLAIAWAYVI
jgi:hypothetical protein